MLTDEDVFIISRKNRKDPFFQHLQYLRNKLNLTGVVVESAYDESLDYDYTGAATECFAGYKSETEMLKKYGEEEYLRYCNQKISLFLNYEQNIRVKRAVFCYSKG